PMFHVNAWGLPFSAALVGAKLVLPGPYLDPPSLLDLMAGEAVTLAAGVPTIWLGVVQAHKDEPGRWKLAAGLTIVSGGAAAPESLWRDIEAMGARGFHGWGMTETSPIGSGTLVKRGSDADAPGDPRYRLLVKQGLPLPFVDVRIVNDAGVAPWDGRASGELQLRGPWVAGAYHGAEEADKWTADGWFATGDVATIDPEGYIELTDRAKDLIKSGGEWISSLALEGAIMDHPAVKEAAVVAVPHPKWQERPLAAVVVRDGLRVTADELAAHLTPRFARWWLPDAYVFVDQIPRTSTGKFQKTALRERFKSWDWTAADGGARGRA
ncbi:MAG: AMP-binding protein, partial [Alphaproteobacteria bacterium]